MRLPSPATAVEGRTFAWAAAIVMAGTVASRLLGLVRQQVFAIEFGTTGQMELLEDISATTGMGLGVHTCIYPDGTGFFMFDNPNLHVTQPWGDLEGDSPGVAVEKLRHMIDVWYAAN